MEFEPVRALAVPLSLSSEHGCWFGYMENLMVINFCK